MHRASFPHLLLALGLLAASACGVKQPVLYPNAQLMRVGQERARADIAACNELAHQYAGVNEGAEVAKKTASAAAAGGATGAVGGAIVGRPGTGAAIGAATRGTASLARRLFSKRDPDPVVRRFVERCLRERGYAPIGWR